MDDPDKRIAELEAEVAILTQRLHAFSAAVDGRLALVAVRDSRGNCNLNHWKGDAPNGYRLLIGPTILTAAQRAKVPHAPAVRYEKRGGHWDTIPCGAIVPIEDTARVAKLAQELERK